MDGIHVSNEENGGEIIKHESRRDWFSRDSRSPELLAIFRPSATSYDRVFEYGGVKVDISDEF